LRSGCINGAVNTKGEATHLGNISTTQFTAATFSRITTSQSNVRDGAVDYLPVRPDGVPFSRTPEGLLDFRRFAAPSTIALPLPGFHWQHFYMRLTNRLRRYEAKGAVRKFEHWEMISLILDAHEVCRGLVAMNLTDARAESISRRRRDHGNRRPGLDLRQVD